jgi:proline-rich tail region repeat protein
MGLFSEKNSAPVPPDKKRVEIPANPHTLPPDWSSDKKTDPVVHPREEQG